MPAYLLDSGILIRHLLELVVLSADEEGQLTAISR